MSEESFADAPESIGWLRAQRTGDTRTVTVRDLLVAMLRLIDRGDIAPDAAVLAIRIPDPEGTGWTLRQRCAGLTSLETVGLLTMAAIDQTTGDDGGA